MNSHTEHSTDQAQRLLGLYRDMLRIRRFEERAFELFQSGDVTGTAHSCVGQEAIAVGVASALQAQDYVVGHHRSHGHVISKGGDLRGMMAELLGRQTGICKGLGGSMHIADLELNILGCNGIVGAPMPIGCGAALASTLLGRDSVTVVFFGDGASNQGASHEAMNLAATWRLPVVFVCENNQFALSVDWRASRATEDIAPRAAGYGIPWEIVDGNDIEAVAEAAQRFVDAARRGEGPGFIEAKTYRRAFHSMRANLPDTRDPEIVAKGEAGDPIPRAEKALNGHGIGGEELDAVAAGVDAEIEVATQAALQDEVALEADMLAAVYAPRRDPGPEPEPGERQLSYMQAINEAMRQEMERDATVMVMGEDVGRVGGLWRATEGLYEAFGAERVRDTPISETGFVGAGVGAALSGLRPIVELQFFDFCAVTMDQIANQAAKLRFMMGGAPRIPLVIRGASGGGVRLGAQHSQSLEAWFCHIPGLTVVMPASPYDAKGLLTAAIRDDNPVILLEPKTLFYGYEAAVPEEPYELPIGRARIVKKGSDVTVVAVGAAVPLALRAAGALEREGVSVEVVDPRTLYPLDLETICASVAKTNRLVIAHEAVKFGGIGAEIAAQVGEAAFWELDRPIGRVAAMHTPIPYQKELEAMVLPGADDIAAAIRALA